MCVNGFVMLLTLAFKPQLHLPFQLVSTHLHRRHRLHRLRIL